MVASYNPMRKTADKKSGRRVGSRPMRGSVDEMDAVHNGVQVFHREGAVGVGNEGREIISREARKIVEQMEVLKNEIETIIAKDSLTHADSLVVKNKLIELKKLNDILN